MDTRLRFPLGSFAASVCLLSASCDDSSTTGSSGTGGSTSESGSTSISGSTVTGSTVTGSSNSSGTGGGIPADWLFTVQDDTHVHRSTGQGDEIWVGRGVNVDDLFLCGYNYGFWMT